MLTLIEAVHRVTCLTNTTWKDPNAHLVDPVAHLRVTVNKPQTPCWEFGTAYLGWRAQLAPHNWLHYRPDLTPPAHRITGRVTGKK